jgi:hypothetical protein
MDNVSNCDSYINLKVLDCFRICKEQIIQIGFRINIVYVFLVFPPYSHTQPIAASYMLLLRNIQWPL